MPLQTIETFIQFKDYFKGFKDTLGIKDFVFGDSNRILNAQNSVLDYPVFWLHTPDIKPYESGGRKNRFTSDFLILKAAAVDDYDQQESNFNDSSKPFFGFGWIETILGIRGLALLCILF